MWLTIINTQNDLINEIKKTQNNIKDGTYRFDICTNNLDIIDPQYKTQNYKELFTYIKPQNSEFGRVYYIVHGEISKSKIIFSEHYPIQLYEIDGVLLQPTLGYYDTKKTFGFTIANDKTNYKLPHNWESENKPPKKTSKPNEKVLRNWLNWLQLKYNAQNQLNQQKQSEINLFLNEINNIKQKEDTITNNYGKLKRNGIVFTYNIENNNINTKIDIDYTLKHANKEQFLNTLNELTK